MATSTTAPETPNLVDSWTPDQELTLLKAIVKYKPVGVHAHFRMLSIQQYLLNSGTCTPDDEHTRIPGIWAKLRTLYDLERLNEREDAIISSTATDDETQSGADYWRDFELPRDDSMGGDFEQLMWERRLAPEGTGSPEWSGAAEGAKARRESTVPGTDEPRSSPIPGSVTRGMRGGRRGGRVSRLKNEAEAAETRSSRRGSKAASEVGTKDDDGDENMEDVDDDEDGSSDEEEEEESSEQEEEDEKRGPAKRGRGGKRGRGRRGRRRG